MYYIFFIHGSADGHLDYFHVLVIINGASVNIGMHVPFGIMVLSEYILEKEMAAHSSILAWKIPWTVEPCRLLFMGLQRVRHDCVTEYSDPQRGI